MLHNAKQFFTKVQGRFFYAKWVKKDGTLRTGVFRLGVSKFTNGVGLRYDPKKYDLQIVWEPAKCKGKDTGYRMMKISNIVVLRSGSLTCIPVTEAPKFQCDAEEIAHYAD